MKTIWRRALFLGIIGGWMGCHSPPRIEKLSVYRMPPTEMGVRTTRTGEAVAEIDRPPQAVFEMVENELRKEKKVVFVNRSNRQIEAETQSLLFRVFVTVLTTGKTGLTVTAMDRSDRKAKPEAARELADGFLARLRNAE